jgi:diguanylate cyclase (GGDEF)-like protein/PAS domain S-box-containing protein
MHASSPHFHPGPAGALSPVDACEEPTREALAREAPVREGQSRDDRSRDDRSGEDWSREDHSGEDRPRSAALRDAEDFCQRALRAIPDGVVVLDLGGRVKFLNPVAAHLTGWSEAQSLGRPFEEVVRFTDARGNVLDIDALCAGGDITALVRRDGHVILIDGAMAPIEEQRQPAGWVLSFRNVTAAKRLTSELMYHANHDALTGLVNRRAFESRLERAVASAAAQGASHALLCFDLDRFKTVNDRGGHVAGDELLRQLAALLRKQLRERDTLARLGGDEFAVLLEDSSPDDAVCVAEKLRSAVAAFRFTWEGERFGLGASIGLLDFHDGRRSPAELLARADELCYRAKSKGRDRVVAERREEPRTRPQGYERLHAP